MSNYSKEAEVADQNGEVYERWEEHCADIERSEIEVAADQFAARGFAVVPSVSTPEVSSLLADELERLTSERAVRREFLMEETGNSLRKMSNVRRNEIFEESRVVPRMYESTALRTLLGQVAREPVHICPYEPEQCVVTHLEEGGDTHGWHWDDYAFALVWVTECPPIDDGGFVQCVPRTKWDKKNPRVNAQMASSVIYTVELKKNDVYFMRADTTLHRVAPVERGQRTIVNMGYASTADLTKPIDHGTMDTLWADNAKS